MNKNQHKYTAFMESVCKEFNCPEMLPALNAGFKAFCEATVADLPTTLTRTVNGGTYQKHGGEDTWFSENGDTFGTDQVQRIHDNLQASGIQVKSTNPVKNSITCLTNNGFEVVFTIDPSKKLIVRVKDGLLATELEDRRKLFTNGKYIEDLEWKVPSSKGDGSFQTKVRDPLNIIKTWLRDIDAIGAHYYNTHIF